MIFEYDKIVIGSNLKAVLFAFNNCLPIAFSEALRPFRFDFLAPDIDLSSVKIEKSKTTLKTFDGDKIVGTPKEMLW